MSPVLARLLPLLLLGALTATAAGGDPADGSAVPVGFLDEVVVDGLTQAAGMLFVEDGRVLVFEQRGVVRLVEDGVLQPEPFLDIREEVALWGTHGLLGLALDPDFLVNGHVYACYAVDYHHLMNFGTPGYDPGVSQTFVDTIGRVTRFTANAADGFRTVDPATRLVLLGESPSTGIPICSTSHSTGELLFGSDGTLLVATGDNASGPASGTCLADGILQPKEDVGAFRSQLIDSLAGKLLRLDPATGDGVPSNPFFDPAHPRAPRSRVWALGLRNPFRMALRPGTGARDPAFGNPGTLLVADVGENDWEELDLVDAPGLNFGWPLYEGLEPFAPHFGNPVENLDAPNPLHGRNVPPFGVCDQPYFHFQDLLVQDSLNPPSWPHPCEPGLPVVTAVPTHEHRRPVIEWAHSSGAADGGGDHEGEGLARVPTYDAGGEAAVALLGEAGAPVEGEAFLGACGVAGTFYDHTAFPAGWQGTAFVADYTQGWIRSLVFDGAGTLLAVNEFKEPGDHLVDLEVDPTDGSLWYVEFTSLGAGLLHRVSHQPTNVPPTAVIDLEDAPWGAAPLSLTFDGTGSTDPEGQPLAYEWDFGDGTPVSRLPVTTHVFPSEDITAQGAIIGRVFELSPPGSMGTGNEDPQVLRDGDWPAVGTDAPLRQYDTIHVDASQLPALVPDKGPLDWLGYEFPGDRRIHAVIYQEGMAVAGLGGWWDTLGVQFRRNGQWLPVTGLVIEPPYAGDAALDYETYELRFDVVGADAVRLVGEPGGSLEYVSSGELRVLAEPLPPGPGPQNSDVTLTVRDTAGASGTDGLTVSAGNSPPQVEILSPPDGGTYSTSLPQMVTLQGAATDAEHASGELSCSWQVVLHHAEHTHPGPLDPNCDTTALLVTDGCDDSLHFQELRFTATDPLGLSATASHYLVPDCDRNLNGVDDALDIASGASLDLDHDGVPDEAEIDCDNDGVPDLFGTFFGLVPDADGDGVPDACDNGLPPLLDGPPLRAH